MYMFWLLL